MHQMYETYAASVGPSTREIKDIPKLLTPRQFYEAFDGAIGINTVYELLRCGRIKSVSVGRKYLIPQSELEAWPQREAERFS